MTTSESSADARLTDLPVGARAIVAAVDGVYVRELALEGIHVGTSVVVRARAPLGGPLVVEVGPARVAVARVVARGVSVDRDPDPPAVLG